MGNKDLQQLLSMAILREVQAYTFYKGVADQTHDKNVKEIFEDLARQEQGHEDLLDKFRKDPSIANKIKAPADYKIAEGAELPDLNVAMKPVDAITLAMLKEQQAADFYLMLAENCVDEESRNMCKSLSEIELTHKHRLENIFVNIAFPEVW